MRIKIDIVTGYSTYRSLSWTKEDQQQHATDPDFQNEDDQKYAKQMEEILQADDDKDGIAYDLLIGAGGDCMMIEPYFSHIEVSYPDGEHEDEEIRPDDEVSNNWKDLSEYYQQKITDPKNLVLILRADHMKRGLFGAEIESNKPFNINYLSVMDGEITYGTDTIDYVDGGEGYDSETQIYCDTDGEED